MATIRSTTLLNLLLISSFFLILLLGPACKADNILYPGRTLVTNTYLEYGSYKFIMQQDCNLVLYDKGIPYWHSNTAGRGINFCHCTMQTDGNLVIFAPNGRAIWTSKTAKGQGSYVLILQSDRNVVIYGGAIWATETNGTGSGAIPVVSWVSSEDTNHTAVVDGSGTNIDM
ncbi:mannose-specific lectin-like [Magnolia sinica]|uniref:mannose-specific lectin-like n=1 Tax=Magnolia sinica TaxID=86752 RepID=UPI00265AD187|nr:mannose-specific lectin-like [Magnolia sinica]